ncbi:ABC transporter substrate-binding protein [Cohnella sp. GbtcB17]|uniref:ABC transporter substrate-binding protein n=1 Tax=Cohnella sp. GbtcB17 TaxID=2824762 RepID=UPI0020C65426|nr:ABC transporter substrate-binding protein [Cohnella sp. GbtcB17]
MMNRFKWWPTLVGLMLLLVLLSACGNGNNEASGSPSAGAGATAGASTGGAGAAGSGSPAASAGASEAAAAYPRTVTSVGGDVTLPEQPKKVAVLHWGYTDSLLLFDLDSAAFALPFTEKQSLLGTDAYKAYADKIADIRIVGENTEVNLEKLAAYGPDLIIAGNKTNEKVLPQLSQVATTVVIDEARTDVWSNWPALVTEIGKILGQEQVAADYIAGYRSELAAAKEKLAALQGTVAFLQVRDKTVYLQGSDYLKDYYDGLGLKAPEGDIGKSGAELSLEGLSALDPDYLILGYFNYHDSTMAAFTDTWKDSTIWKNLKAVKNGHVYGVDGQLVLGYGPIDRRTGVKVISDALSSAAQ